MKLEVSKYEKKIAELHAQVETEARLLSNTQSHREAEERTVASLQEHSLDLQGKIDAQKSILDVVTQDIERKRVEGEEALATRRRKHKEVSDSVESARKELYHLQQEIKQGRQQKKEYTGLHGKYETLKRKFRILAGAMKKLEADTSKKHEQAKQTLLQAMEIRDQANQHKTYWETQKTSLENRERNVRVYSKRIIKYYKEQGLNPPTDL